MKSLPSGRILLFEVGFSLLDLIGLHVLDTVQSFSMVGFFRACICPITAAELSIPQKADQSDPSIHITTNTLLLLGFGHPWPKKHETYLQAWLRSN